VLRKNELCQPYTYDAPMITKQGKLRTPLHSPAKKSKDVMGSGQLGRSIEKTEMVDVGTDTVLTPNW